MIDAQPLPHRIYARATNTGITKIALNFEGGSDEGYLDITMEPVANHDADFASVIEEWAWDVYSYSGAGDGNAYGDHVIYDLKEKMVYLSEWTMERTEGDTGTDELQIMESDEIDELE